MAKQASKNPNWGGPRPGFGGKQPGSGRKPLGDKKNSCKIVTLPPDMWKIIDERGRSKFIRTAVEEKLEREKAALTK